MTFADRCSHSRLWIARQRCSLHPHHTSRSLDRRASQLSNRGHFELVLLEPAPRKNCAKFSESLPFNRLRRFRWIASAGTVNSTGTCKRVRPSHPMSHFCPGSEVRLFAVIPTSEPGTMVGPPRRFINGSWIERLVLRKPSVSGLV